jgi:hypothetical protein
MLTLILIIDLIFVLYMGLVATSPPISAAGALASTAGLLAANVVAAVLAGVL